MHDLLNGYRAPDLAGAVAACRPVAERFVAEDGVLSVDEAALAFALVGLFPDEAVGVTARRLWRRALCLACAARSIAVRSGTGGPADAFRTGLLRDAGCFVLTACAPLATAEALTCAHEERVTLDAACFDACGVGLHEAGEHLRRTWDLAPVDAAIEAAVTLAAFLVDLRRMRLPGESFEPSLDESVWPALGLDPEALVDLTEGLTDDADRSRRLYAAARGLHSLSE